MKNISKILPYECGLPSFTNHIPFQYISLHAIIGILYVLFDLEILFLYPLASTLSLCYISTITFYNIFIFFLILSLSFLYEWYEGPLEILSYE
jgi:NADH:ubiquinone oxidoreductase subunit 3 (subunit A)